LKTGFAFLKNIIRKDLINLPTVRHIPDVLASWWGLAEALFVLRAHTGCRD
jgi:hypothetical protein